MGCNCRNAKKLRTLLTGEDHKPGILARIIQGLMFLAVLVLVLPFALIYLYISYVVRGDFLIKIPNIVNKFKRDE